MLVLSVVPVYLLLGRLVNSSAAAAGSLFYCVMPSISRLGADALSDSTQLCLFASALYCLARWWSTRPNDLVEISNLKSQISNLKDQPTSAIWIFAAGLLIGLALLARPEAAVLVPAMLMTIGGLQFGRHCRLPWPGIARAIPALLLGIALCQVPYAWATASYSEELFVARLLGRDRPSPQRHVSPSAVSTSAEACALPDGQKMVFGLKDRSVSSRFHGYRSAVREYLRELPEACGYWIGAAALIGAALLRRSATRPFDLFALVLFVSYSLCAIHFAANLGYLSARHFVPLVLLTLAPAGYAACHGAAWLCQRTGHARLALAWGTVAIAAAACLPKTLAPLHPTRIGHRQAGQWLASQSQSPGTVLDTRGWTAFYSGRPTLRYDVAPAAFRLAGLAYVVVEQRELELDSARARTLQHLLSTAADRVAMFAAPGSRAQDNVLVYRWHSERFASELLAGPLIAKTQAAVQSDP